MLKIIKIILFFMIPLAAVFAFVYPARYNMASVAPKHDDKGRDYTGFLDDVENKRVFFVPIASTVPVANPAAVDEVKILRDNLRLCGVIESNGLKAIIEDKQAGKSSCASVGGVVAQGVTVKAINKDSVTLTYDGADFDLHL